LRRAAVAVALFGLLAPTGARAATGDIRTIAGGGAGDGLPAVNANLPGPSGIAIDASGNLFVADRLANRIREVTTDGVMHTLAGTGAVGYFGDGGPASLASLNGPASLALDPATGDLYIADAGNNRIRKIRADGTIVTIAGSGAVRAYGGDGGPATAALLASPQGVYFDAPSHSVFVADTLNNRVRKIDANGIITTVAGNGSGGYYGDQMKATDASVFEPTGVLLDPAGNIFIADQYNHRVRKVDTSGTISTYAGSLAGGRIEGVQVPLGDGLPAPLARLYFPTSLLLDGAGNLYITDTWDHRVRKVDPNGFISTVAGSGTAAYGGDGGPATAAMLDYPEGVAIHPATHELYFSDTDNHRVRRIDAGGDIHTVAGNGSTTFYGDGGPAAGASLYYPSSVASVPDGTLLISDVWNQRIRAIRSDGTITTIAGNGESGFAGDGGPASSASFNYPNDIARDTAGNLYVADTLNNRVRKIDTTGKVSTVAGSGLGGYDGDDQPAVEASLKQPFGVAVDAAGNLFIADTGNNRIREVTPDGTITTVAGRSGAASPPTAIGDGGPAASAYLVKPYDVVVDPSGNLLIADSGNLRVRAVDMTSGIISTFAGNGQVGSFPSDGTKQATDARLSRPYALLCAGGQVYIADAGAERVYRVSAAGFIFRVAGGGTGFGDGGPAIAAGLHGPSGLAMGADGTIYIADALAHRVRAVAP
jgi:sugar lactone lactonase YvrE